MTGRRPAAALAGIVLAGLALRLWAFGGVTAAHLGDDTRYIAVARNLANGYPPQGDAEWFGARVAFLWPVALLFRLAGASDYTAVAWPLLTSLAAIVAAYLVGRELAGARVGLTAAAVVAVTPLEALMATRLRPDAVMPAFIALAVWAALRSRRSPHPVRWAAAAGVLLGVGWSAREMAVVMAPVVVAAAWPVRPRTVIAGVAGFLAAPAVAVAAFALAGGDPWMPITATAGASEGRNPLSAWGWDGSYVGWAVRGLADPGHPAFLGLILVTATVTTLVVTRERRAWLPAAWVGWAVLYLEVPALANLSPSPRFLLLASIPMALLVGLAAERWTRTGRVAVPAVVLAVAVAALQPVAERENRRDDVLLVNRVAAELRRLPAAPVLSEDHTWWTKIGVYLAVDRIPVPAATDPAFLDASRRQARRMLTPLPDVASYRGGYVLIGPVTPRAGWPRNWSAMRRRIRAEVPWHQLTLVLRVGDAYVYRWPAAEPARRAEHNAKASR